MLQRHRRLFPDRTIGKRWALAVLASTLVLAAPAHAEEPLPWLSTGFLLFGDVYHVPTHHLVEGDGATGLVLRRGYLTWNAAFDDNWFGRLRFELNQSGEFETYDLELDFKDAYVGRRFGRHEAIVGLSPTLTFDVVEKSWGKRHLMRTPMDLQGEPSRDTGASLKGPITGNGQLSYRIMAGSGAEFGAESGDGRKYMAALNWRIDDRWMVDVYVDTEKLAGRRDRNTLQGFVEYDAQRWRLGVLYSNQDRQDDPPLELASAWWIGSLGERSEFIARVDRIIEPSPRGDNISYIPFDPTAPATMFYTGIELALSEHVSLTPNIIVTSYDRAEDGTRPETDLYLRLTAFVNFE
jgi:hypothetical protein